MNGRAIGSACDVATAALRAALVMIVITFASHSQAQQTWDGPALSVAPSEAPPGVDTSDAAAERLRARTTADLTGPVPLDPAAVAFELEVVRAQRDAIDVTDVAFEQGFGIAFVVLTGVACIVGLVGMLVASAGGSSGDNLWLAASCGGVGGGAFALGVTLLAVAETSGALRRRRALGSRIRRLEAGSVSLEPTGLTIPF